MACSIRIHPLVRSFGLGYSEGKWSCTPDPEFLEREHFPFLERCVFLQLMVKWFSEGVFFAKYLQTRYLIGFTLIITYLRCKKMQSLHTIFYKFN